MSTKQTPAAPTDTTTPAVGTTPPSTVPPAEGGDGGSATEPPGTEATPPADEWANFDADRAKQTIQNQRRAEAELKRANAEMKAKLDEIERAKLSDAERTAADLEKSNAELAAARGQVFSAKFDAAAIAAGVAPNALAAARAVAGDVSSTDDSGIVSVDTAVFDRLKAEHGYLFGSQAAPQPHVSFGAAASQGPGGTQGHGLTADQVAMANRARIPLDEFAKYSQRTKR